MAAIQTTSEMFAAINSRIASRAPAVEPVSAEQAKATRAALDAKFRAGETVMVRNRLGQFNGSVKVKTFGKKERSQAVRDLTADIARDLLSYDPETGELLWKERPRSMFPSTIQWKTWNTRFAGKPALSGVADTGYRRGGIFGHQYRAHRVIWLIQTGSWPALDIDHINGVRSDNRWVNLREVTHQVNGRNQAVSSKNRSGVSGVHFRTDTKRWIAYITVDGRRSHLGTFGSFEEAVAARLSAQAAHGFTERHGTGAVKVATFGGEPVAAELPAFALAAE